MHQGATARTFLERRALQIAIERACERLRRIGLPDPVVAAFTEMASRETCAHEVWKLASAWTQRDKARFTCAKDGECAGCGHFFSAGDEHWCLR
jgi:hypothetical protein